MDDITIAERLATIEAQIVEFRREVSSLTALLNPYPEKVVKLEAFCKHNTGEHDREERRQSMHLIVAATISPAFLVFLQYLSKFVAKQWGG